MGIRKVGKMYWLDIRIKGKRIRRSLRTTKKLEAFDRFKEKHDELMAEHHGKRIRFSDFCKKYMEWAWTTKPKTAQQEEWRLKKIYEFFKILDVIFLEDITPYHIDQLKTWLKKQKISEKRTYSETTINRYLQLLRGMFNRAIDWGKYEKQNPLKKVRFYREQKETKLLNDEELEKVLKAAEEISQEPRSRLQKVFYDLMIFALNTGLRKSELLFLKRADIKEGVIVVKGKGGKLREIPLNKNAREVFRKQPGKKDFFFDIPNRDQPDLFRRTIEHIRRKSGVDFHFHLLRHRFASSLLEKGVDFVTIGDLLGHSKFTTSLIYSHTDDKRKKRAVEFLEK